MRATLALPSSLARGVAVLRLLLAALLPLLTACGQTTTEDPSAELAAAFPEHAARALSGAAPFEGHEGGFGLGAAGRDATAVDRDGLEIHLPETGAEPVLWRTRGGLAVELREIDGGGRGALSEATVVYPGEGKTSFWSATANGYEQWLRLEAERVRRDEPVAVWEVSGATPVLNHGYVELLDEAGVPRIRGAAREAYSTTGEPVAVRLAVAGRQVELWVDAEGEAVLADPGWTSTGLMVDGRAFHTAIRLQDGKVLAAGGLGNSVLGTAEIFDPKTNTWSPTGPMNSARRFHTATLLSSGRVLVTGGRDSTGKAVSAAEIYEPATGAWDDAGALSEARHSHTATLLPNGKVLVAGGSIGGVNATSTADLFDPATGIWSSPGDMTTERVDHTATLLPNGKVLVAGGWTSSGLSSTAELYDPATNTWTLLGNLLSAHIRHTATLLPNGKVLVAGGSTGNATSAAAEVFDPVSSTWTSVSSMPEARDSHGAALLPNGDVLVVGGSFTSGNGALVILSSAVLYNPATSTWSATSSVDPPRRYHATTPLADGRVLTSGGANQFNIVLPVANIYDPEFRVWEKKGAMSVPRRDHMATRLFTGQVLVAGGITNSDLTNKADLYDPATGAWTATGNLITARAYHTATFVGASSVLVLVAGGSTTSGTTNKSEVYNPLSGAWIQAGNMTTARTLHTATWLPNGKVLVAGGLSGSLLGSSELFDLAGMWSMTGNLVTARANHTATLLANGKVLVAGGADGVGNFKTAELYDPATGAWTATGDMVQARSRHRAERLPDGKVLVTGGVNFAPLSSAELYDPATGTWSSTTPMSIARATHVMILLDPDAAGKRRVLVAGGTVGAALSSAEVYDIETATWLPASSMWEPREGARAVKLLDGTVLTTGGGNGLVASAGTERFVPAPKGATCLYAGDCAEGFCADQVCCDTACDGGACDACSPSAGATSSGTCQPLGGIVCSDGDLCTPLDLCVAGQCVPQLQSKVTCSPASDPCNDPDQCNPASGECEPQPKPAGTPCDDDDKCTLADTCQAGVCVPGVVAPCQAKDTCHVPGVCDPATGLCDNPPGNEGAACDDGDACTHDDLCNAAGGCKGTAVVCASPDVCFSAACDPSTGQCVFTTTAVPCNDKNACTSDDTCDEGQCLGVLKKCDAPPPCKAPGVCDPASGDCEYEDLPAGTPCDDGDACTLQDACQGGVCAPAETIACPALDVCHDPGTCDPATGLCSHPEKDEGADCDDGDACTQEDECKSGVCTGGSQVQCPEPDACHKKGTCDPGTGLCDNPVKDSGVPCDADQDPCTPDTCESGVCQPAPPMSCGEYGCDSATGACRDRCTSADECAPGRVCDPEGRCVPSPPRRASFGDTSCSAGPSGETPGGAGWTGPLALLAASALRRRRRSISRPARRTAAPGSRMAGPRAP